MTQHGFSIMILGRLFEGIKPCDTIIKHRQTRITSGVGAQAGWRI